MRNKSNVAPLFLQLHNLTNKMNKPSTISVLLTAFLMCGKPALAADNSFLPKTADDWALFIVMCMMMLLSGVMFTIMSVLIYLGIRGHYYKRGVIKKMDREYDFLSAEEKDTISKLEMEIDKTLDVYKPGSDKYSDAWKEWSKEHGNMALMEIKGGLLSTSWRKGVSPYGVVEHAMKRTEFAMREEKRWKELLEETNMESNKERYERRMRKASGEREKWRRLSAILWAIWWQAEMKRKMEGENKFRKGPKDEV